MLADVGLGADFWLQSWNWQPSIILGTIVVIGLYLYAVGPLRERFFPQESLSIRQAILFLLGVNIIFLSLFSPLDALGDDYLFSAHMVQHLCLTIVGPPLLVAGTPAWLVQPLLRKPQLLRIGRFLTYPLVAFILYNANFWLWHVPTLYDMTLYDPNLHLLEHLTFIVLSVIYWWPVFGPMTEELPRLGMGGQILYIFLGGMPTVALGAGLTFSSPLYTPYIYAPRIWGISAATDQQLGGLIMWVPANIAYIIVASVLFLRWMLAQERRQQAEEARLYMQSNQGEESSEHEEYEEDGEDERVEQRPSHTAS